MVHPDKKNKYHVEILTPKHHSENLEADLLKFEEKYNRVIKSNFCVSIPDNAMGHLAFQGTEVIEELDLEVYPEQIIIHLNTFHSRKELHSILDSCKSMGIKYLLIISGDGSEYLHKLQPSDLGISEDIKSVTSVELLKYINDEYPDTFVLGVAFNPYEPPEHEFKKLQRKLNAGAAYIITQPIIEKNSIIDQLLIKHPDISIIVEAWMSKKLNLLSNAVGYEISADKDFDPVETLRMIHKTYSGCGIYLSFLGFKAQYPIVEEILMGDS